MGIVAFALQTLHEFLSYYPVLLPTLLIFSRESASSVKIWQAVQRIPHPNPVSKNEDGEPIPLQKTSAPQGILKGTWMFVVLVVSMIAIYVGALLVVPGWILKDELKIKIFYTCTLSIPFYANIISTATSMGEATILYRDADGKLAKMFRKDKSALSKIISAVLGVPITAGALWFGYPLAVLLVYATLLHVMNHPGICTDKMKFKSLFTFAILLSVPMLFLIGVVTGVILYGRGNGVFMGDGPLYSFVSRGNPLVDWRSILACVSSSFLQFQILSMAYRFDYANSLPSGFQPLVGRKTNIGFRIPSLRYYPVGEAFPRPYFSVALAALIVSYMAVAALCVAGFIEVTYETAPIATMTFSLVVTASSMLALATMKDQFSKLWAYEEDWTVIPSPNEPEVHEVDLAEQEDENVHGKDFLLFSLDDEKHQGGQNV